MSQVMVAARIDALLSPTPTPSRSERVANPELKLLLKACEHTAQVGLDLYNSYRTVWIGILDGESCTKNN